MFFELLTGQLPYDDSKRPMAQLYDKTRFDPPKPSSVVPDYTLPAELDRVILKAMARAPGDRYQDGDELFYDLVTYSAEGLLKEALPAEKKGRALLRRREPDMDRVHDHMNRWASLLEAAFNEYKRAYQRLGMSSLQERMFDICMSLVRWADVCGNEGLRQRWLNEARLLEPKNQQIDILERSIRVILEYDGEMDRSDTRFVTSLGRFTDNSGVLNWDGFEWDGKNHIYEGLILNDLRLPRGSAYTLQVQHPEFHPIARPLPVRPADEPHVVRIPLYEHAAVPPGWLTVPAGRVPVRNFSGRLGERVKKSDWRAVNYDFAFSPKITNDEYLDFLIWGRREIEKHRNSPDWKHLLAAFGARIPGHWNKKVREHILRGRFDDDKAPPLDWQDRKGRPLYGNAPVTGVTYKHAVNYAEWKYPRQGVLPADLNEWKLAMRGVDRRTYPWGDKLRRGAALWRFAGFNSPSKVMPNDYAGTEEYPILDHSPYSIYGANGIEMGIRWMVSNVQTQLRMTDTDIAQMILDATDLEGVNASDPKQLAQWAFVVGNAYDHKVPMNIDPVQPIAVEESAALERVGFNLVKRLKSSRAGARATPLITSLVG